MDSLTNHTNHSNVAVPYGWPDKATILATGLSVSAAVADGNYQETVRAMKLIMAPGQVTELRALGVSTPEYRRTHTVSGYFDDIRSPGAGGRWRLHPDAMGVYFTPNPVNPALLARAANRARAGQPGTAQFRQRCRCPALVAG